ncbi:hypothetical protein AFE_2108 [Acidithiobacillus ferrooxidans ATCC 23270]|uniref:Uncharacterized protein n=1 Tax=Acidithiobacillus ferrooxidans (strain ATCC 23270 / DSM 14882 / CIP 104768 / NCIMB 8455) TaxID=243159 RepID=B7J4W7_ACIF2|nr:hypothetical protein AFE_2108 [Acidithiobacillus ferrooxidans ATCC 23270]
MHRSCAQAGDMKAGGATGAPAVLPVAPEGASAAIAIVGPARLSPKMAAIVIFLNIDPSSIFAVCAP